MSDGRRGEKSLPTELRPSNRRIEAFSDAVFAIVVTIMILEIRIPDELAVRVDQNALTPFVAVIGTYALSFIVIAIFWSNHHYLIFTLPKADRTTIWLNNNALFWITLIPIVGNASNPGNDKSAALIRLLLRL